MSDWKCMDRFCCECSHNKAEEIERLREENEELKKQIGYTDWTIELLEKQLKTARLGVEQLQEEIITEIKRREAAGHYRNVGKKGILVRVDRLLDKIKAAEEKRDEPSCEETLRCRPRTN